MTTERDAIQNFEEVFASLPITDDARTEARLCAVQAIFSWRLLGEDLGIQDQFLAGPVKTRKAQKSLFNTLFLETKYDVARFEALVSGCLQEDWGFARISTIGQAILLVGAAELATQGDTPVGAIIGDYLAIARAYEDDKQVKFMHGVLDAVGQKVR